ncbi:DUF6273 domain-containing protein [Enterococcus sp. LJL51]|uniref:DUF6273 domain-containing protein n=1 Tax=Enterococcus sp. LJL51 TaxID=3416656 RepID=UPI003CEC50E9
MKIGDKTVFGSYQWRVLDIKNEHALLLAEDIVGQQAFHDKAEDVTWETCALRKYLNTEFLHQFNAADQARIAAVTNKNSINQWYGTTGGEDTEDKIFLLSLEEAACYYFGNSSRLLYHPGKNQKYWFQRKDENSVNRRAQLDGYSWWWLRSTGRDKRRAVYIWGNGTIGIQGNGTFNYNSQDCHPLTGDNSGGIRPALWLSLY